MKEELSLWWEYNGSLIGKGHTLRINATSLEIWSTQVGGYRQRLGKRLFDCSAGPCAFRIQGFISGSALRYTTSRAITNRVRVCTRSGSWLGPPGDTKLGLWKILESETNLFVYMNNIYSEKHCTNKCIVNILHFYKFLGSTTFKDTLALMCTNSTNYI